MPQTPNTSQVKQAITSNKQKTKSHYDKNAKTLPRLNENDLVIVQIQDSKWHPAIITNKHNDRSFIVQTPDGATYRRNRRKLIKSNEDKHACQDKLPKHTTNTSNVLITSASNLKLMDQIKPPIMSDSMNGKQTSVPQQTNKTRSGRLIKPKIKFSG